jgi:hypothetical protein
MIEYLDRVLIYLYQISPGAASKEELTREVFANDPTVPIDAILLHLLEQGNIYPVIYIEHYLAIEIPDCYSISVPGIIFFQQASLPGMPYQSAEEERQRKASEQIIYAKVEKREAFIKLNWMLLPLITFLLCILATVGSEYFKRKMWPDPKAGTQILVIHDTLYTPATRATK